MFFLRGLIDFLTIYFRRPKFFAMFVIIVLSVGITMDVYSSRVVEHIPVYVTDLDNSTISRTVRSFLHAVPDISVEGVADNAEEAKQALIEGRVAGIVFIPNGLSKVVKTQQPASIKVYIDGSNIVEARNLDRALQTVVKSTSIGISMIALSKQGVHDTELMPLLQPINLDVDRPFNPHAIYTDYLLPVLIFFNLCPFFSIIRYPFSTTLAVTSLAKSSISSFPIRSPYFPVKNEETFWPSFLLSYENLVHMKESVIL